MSGRIRTLIAIAVVTGLAAPALAQKAIPKPSDRRVGELEGWTEPQKANPPAGKAKAAQEAKGKNDGKGKQAKAQAKPAQPKDPEDGGLPLPGARGEDKSAPVSFDSKGNIGTGFKF